ncbi:MAG TPA: hypothetical protein VNJ51_05615 [Candidatus Dormibacteraeota bacterium]|nr:hypothetical protein [Candidatus Dormibacteraeota bacterium]
MLDALFFALLLLEVDLGHQPALAGGAPGLALVPVVTVPLALLALAWALLRPSAPSVATLQATMALLGLVGITGFFAHLQASGVGLATLSRLFDPGTWEGPACPNWPIAITLAAVLGAVGAPGAATAERSADERASAVLVVPAFALVLLSVPLVLVPVATGLGSTAVVAGCLLFIAAVAGEVSRGARNREAL